MNLPLTHVRLRPSAPQVFCTDRGDGDSVSYMHYLLALGEKNPHITGQLDRLNMCSRCVEIIHAHWEGRIES